MPRLFQFSLAIVLFLTTLPHEAQAGRVIVWMSELTDGSIFSQGSWDVSELWMWFLGMVG